MAKKNDKNETIKVFTSIESTLMQMPKYNTHAIGNGVYSDKRYSKKNEQRIKNSLKPHNVEY